MSQPWAPTPDPADPAGDGADVEPLRILVLVRHGKARDSSPSGDAGRELSGAGRSAATELGRWLAGQGVRPDAAVVSPSTRTRQTWEALEAGGLSAGSVWADAALYEAEAVDVVESIGAVSDDVRTLVVVGHAPAIPAVARDLPDHRDGAVTPLAEAGWPPATCAVVGHRGSWADFPGDASAVVAVRFPA